MSAIEGNKCTGTDPNAVATRPLLWKRACQVLDTLQVVSLPSLPPHMAIGGSRTYGIDNLIWTKRPDDMWTFKEYFDQRITLNPHLVTRQAPSRGSSRLQPDHKYRLEDIVRCREDAQRRDCRQSQEDGADDSCPWVQRGRSVSAFRDVFARGARSYKLSRKIQLT